MGKLRIEGNGGQGESYLGWHIPPNTLMISFGEKLEIWSAPKAQGDVGFGRGEERGSQEIHKMAITVPLTVEMADHFRKTMKKKGKEAFNKQDFVDYLITFLEFAATHIMGMGIAPEHARDTVSLRLEEMKKGPVQIHF
jgi:hypothetical protein